MLLVEVERLAQSLEIGGDHSHTCETAGYFYVYHILSRWETYLAAAQENKGTIERIVEDFPFGKIFCGDLYFFLSTSMLSGANVHIYMFSGIFCECPSTHFSKRDFVRRCDGDCTRMFPPHSEDLHGIR